MFATIILSWNSLKCILWYLLELSDPFVNNETSVLPILIAKNFEQKIYFCLLKMRSIFFKEEKSNFLNFMQKIQDFSFHTFWKKTIAPRHTPAQGCRISPNDKSNGPFLYPLIVVYSFYFSVILTFIFVRCIIFIFSNLLLKCLIVNMVAQLKRNIEWWTIKLKLNIRWRLQSEHEY